MYASGTLHVKSHVIERISERAPSTCRSVSGIYLWKSSTQTQCNYRESLSYTVLPSTATTHYWLSLKE